MTAGILAFSWMLAADPYTFSKIDFPGASSTSGEGINNAGQIAGYYINGGGENGFLDNNGVFTTIDVPNAPQTMTSGINNAGQIVGTYGLFLDQGQSFLFTNGVFTTINVPNSFYSAASGINDAGQIVGTYADAANGHSRGFLDSNGVFTSIDPPGAFYTRVWGINDAGQIVGDYFIQPGEFHGFLYANGVFTTFDVPGGVSTHPCGINSSGVIAGSYDDGSGNIHSFVDNRGVFSTIDVPGAYLSRACGINTDADVVGAYAIQSADQLDGFVGTPTATPEPVSFLLLLSGLSFVGIISWMRRRDFIRRGMLLLPILSGILATGRANAQAHRITLEDLLSVEPIGDTALSPDGKTFAIARAGQIVLMPSDGGWLVTLTSTTGAKSGLSWSPDSRMIAYASGGSIWSVPASGGPPKRLTHAYPGGGDPRTAADRNPQWSPAGKWILYETGRTGRNSLMVVSQDGATNNFVAPSRADEGSAAWAPDGAHISFTERSPEHFSGQLKVVSFDAKSGQAAADPVALYTAPTDRGGGWSVGRARWSPDGHSLAVLLQDSGWQHVYLVPASGGAPRQITRGDYEDESCAFAPDGKSLTVVSNRDALEQSHIWIVPLNGGEARRLTPFTTPGMESNAEWSPDGERIYFRRATPLESTDLLVSATKKGSQPQFLSHTLPKNFDGVLTVPDKVTYKSKDGMTIQALLYKPREGRSGARFPGVLWIHGGPEAQDSFRLDLWAQYLAQTGYVVLEPNYRGSSGYGEKFRNLNVEDSGGGEMDDVAAGAEYLVASGLVDPKRLAIGGGSHGGTMVAYAVTKYPDLFQAAIELYGVVDRAIFIERTNRNSAIRWMMKMGGTPAEKPEVYRKADALLDVPKIKTPLLVMHGENDPQVPPYESAEFVKALKENGKVYYYFTYAGELHGFSQREHRLDAWRKQLAFLEKYINPQYGLSSSSVDDLLVPGH